MSDEKKKRPERIVGSPYARLIEFSKEHNLEQFRCVLRRRSSDGTVRVIKSYQTLDPNEIDHMVDWVPTEFGGGRYEVEITHPLDLQQRFLNWGFDVEGEPIEPKRPGQPAAGIDQVLQQQHAGSFAPPRQYPQQQMQGSSPIGGIPIGSMPMPMQNQYYQRQASMPTRDLRLEAELDALKRQNELLTRQIADEKHASELRELREHADRQLHELKAGMDQQIQVLKQELVQRRPSEEGGSMKEMFGMMMKQAEMQQSSLNMILQSQANDRKDQLENMRKQMENDLSFRREMYERAAKEKDPTQAAALLDMMGQQTASMLNLVSQAVNSGLLGQSDQDPAWLRAVQQGLTGLQEFGQNILQAKQHEAAMSHLRQPPQPGAPRLPARAAPQQAQVAPRPQQRGTMGGPGGRAVQAPPAAPQGPPVAQTGFGRPPVQPQAQEAQTQEPQAQEGEVEVQQSPPSLLVPIQRFCAAIEQEAPAEVVGDMIYTFVDFLRVNDMLPPEWRAVFEEPSETVEAFLQVFAPHIKPPKKYLDDVGQRIMELEEEYGPEVEDGKPGPSAKPAAPAQPQLRVVDSLEPPLPDREEKPAQPPAPTEQPPQPGAAG